MAIVDLKKFKISSVADAKNRNTLKAGDIVRRQYFDGQDSIYTVMYVESVGEDKVVENGENKVSSYFIGLLLYGDEPKSGEILDFVRVTSLSDPHRSGALYLTSSDNSSPYMDIVDGFTRENAVFCPDKVGSGGYQPIYAGTSIDFLKSDNERYRIARFTNSGSSNKLGMSVKSDTMRNDDVWLVSFKAKANKSTDCNFVVKSSKGTDANKTYKVTSEIKQFFIPVTTNDIELSGREIELSFSGLGIKDDYVEVSDFVIVQLSTITKLSGVTKVRVGLLDGIYDSGFGQLDGYGGYFQKLFATKDVNVSGTITAGDKDGSGATFYAGKIHKNLFKNSLGVTFTENDALEVSYTSPVGIGNVFTTTKEQTTLIGQSEEWCNKNEHKEVCFSLYVKTDEDKDVTIQSNHDEIFIQKIFKADGWTRVYFSFFIKRNRDVKISLMNKDVFFTAPQMEYGDKPSLYQATDNTLNYTDEYGAWMSRGGFGGTIQNPLLKLGEDGSIESKGSGFRIDNDGTGHLAGGAIKFDKEKVNISFENSNIGGEIQGVEDRLDSKIKDVETNFEIKEGQISSSVKEVREKSEQISSLGNQIKTVGEQASKDALLAKEKAELAQAEADRASSIKTSIVELETSVTQTAEKVEANATKVEENVSLSNQSVLDAQAQANKAIDSATDAYNNALDASKKAKEALNSAGLSSEEYKKAKLEAEKANADALKAQSEAEKAQDKANEVALSEKNITEMEATILLTAEGIESQVTKVDTIAKHVDENALLAQSNALLAKKNAESAVSSAENATLKAEEASLKAEEALASAGSSSQSYLDALAEAKKAKADAVKANSDAQKALDEANRAKEEADKAELVAVDVTEKYTSIQQTADEIALTATEVQTNLDISNEAIEKTAQNVADAKKQAESATLKATEANEKALLAQKKADEAKASAGKSSTEYLNAKAEAEKAKADAVKANTKAEEANQSALDVAEKAQEVADALTTVIEKETSITQTAEEIVSIATSVNADATSANEAVKKAIAEATKSANSALEAQTNASSSKAQAEEAAKKALEATEKAKEALENAGASSESYLLAKEEAELANQKALDAQAQAELSQTKAELATKEANRAKSEADKAVLLNKDVTEKYTEINQTADEISSTATEVQTNANQVSLKHTEVIQNANKVSLQAQDIENNKTLIEQTAEKVSSDAKDVAGNKTLIEQTAEKVNINAQKAIESANKAIEAEASINLKADGIVLEASEKSAKKAIDDLEIGGRNLILKTSSILKEGVYSGNDTPYLDGAYASVLDNGVYTVSIYVQGITGTGVGVRLRTYWYIGSHTRLGTLYSRYIKEDGVISFTTNNKPTNANRLYVALEFVSPVSDFPLSYAKLKIEKGNKATDWTPAPEDIDAQFTETNSNLSVLSDKIVANTTSIEQTEKRLKTAETTISQQGDQIALKASQKEVDKVSQEVKDNKALIDINSQGVTLAQNSVKEVKDDLDNLEIGGRNYLLNSSVGTFGFASNSNTTAPMFRGFDESKNSWYIEARNADNRISLYSTWSLSGEFMALDLSEEERDIYFSMDVMCEEDIVLQFGYGSNLKSYSLLANKWQRVSKKYNKTQRKYIYAFCVTNCEHKVFYKNYKVELGSKPTDWTPAPEDIDSKFEETEARIDITDGKIDSNTKLINESNKRLSTAETKILQHEDKISLTASKTELDKLTGDVVKNTSAINQNSKEIELAVQATGNLKEEMSSSLQLTEGKIEANTALINNTDKKLSDANTKISQQADEIALRATKTEVDKVSQAVKDNKALIDVNSQGITLAQNSVKEVKDDLDNLEIGGRNLVLNSDFYNNDKNWLVSDGTINISFNDAINKNVARLKAPSGVVCPRQNINDRLLRYSGGDLVASAIIKFEDIGDIDRIQMRVAFSNITLTKKQHTPIEGADGWYRIVFYDSVKTFDVKSTSVFGFQYFIKPIWVTAIKLEKGNQPTDWTPAPEDIDSKFEETEARIDITDGKIDSNTKLINESNKRLSTAETKILQHEDKISLTASKTELDKLTGDVVKNTSAINQNSKGIELSVKSNKELKEELDNLEIGGRNLIIRSSEEVGTWVSISGDIVTSANHSTTDYIKVEPSNTYSLSKIPSVLVTEGIGGYWRYAWYDEDKVYISRRAEASLHNLQWTIPSNAHYVRLSYPIDSQPKFEKGNKATDWTPAPEDIDAQFAENEAKIEVLEDEIKSTVKKNEFDKLTGRVSTAESKITQTEDEIKGLVTKTEFNKETGSLSTEISKISQKSDGISMRVSETEKDLSTVDGRIKDSIDSMEIGGKNLLLDSGNTVESSGYLVKKYNTSEPLVGGKKYTFVCLGEVNEGNKFGVWHRGGSDHQFHLNRKDGLSLYIHQYQATGTVNQSNLSIYNYPSSTAEKATVMWAALYSGHVKPPIDWTPAPEDTFAEIQILKDSITSTVSSIDKLDTRISKVTQESDKFQVEITKKIGDDINANNEKILSSFTVSDNTISMLGKDISLTGKISFNSLDSSTKSKINNALSDSSKALSDVREVDGKIINRNYIYQKTDTNDNTLVFCLSNDFPRTGDIKVTLSLWGDFSGYQNGSPYGGINFWGDGDNYLLSYKYKWQSDNHIVYEGGTLNLNGESEPVLGLSLETYDGTDIEVRAAKLELGDKATAWIPSPEDTIGLAKLDETIIDGGYLRTELIQAKSITADKIDVDNLIGKKLLTEVNGPRIEAIGSELKVYGYSEHPNIIFGIDKDGYSVLKYLNNDGEEMYNLGPNGIAWGSIKPSSFTKVRFYKLSAYKDKKSLTYFDVSAIKNAIDDWASDFYRYFAGSNPTIKPEDREPEKYIYKVPTLTSIRIDDGIYCTPPISTDKNSQYPSHNTGELIQPGGSSSLYQFTAGVYNKAPIYVAVIYAYRGGMLAYSQNVYWNGGMPDPIQP